MAPNLIAGTRMADLCPLRLRPSPGRIGHGGGFSDLETIKATKEIHEGPFLSKASVNSFVNVEPRAPVESGSGHVVLGFQTGKRERCWSPFKYLLKLVTSSRF